MYRQYEIYFLCKVIDDCSPQDNLKSNYSLERGSMTIDKKDFISSITIKQSLSEQSIRHCTIRIGVINSPYALTLAKN